MKKRILNINDIIEAGEQGRMLLCFPNDSLLWEPKYPFEILKMEREVILNLIRHGMFAIEKSERL